MWRKWRKCLFNFCCAVFVCLYFACFFSFRKKAAKLTLCGKKQNKKREIKKSEVTSFRVMRVSTEVTLSENEKKKRNSRRVCIQSRNKKRKSKKATLSRHCQIAAAHLTTKSEAHCFLHNFFSCAGKLGQMRKAKVSDFSLPLSAPWLAVPSLNSDLILGKKFRTEWMESTYYRI